MHGNRRSCGRHGARPCLLPGVAQGRWLPRPLATVHDGSRCHRGDVGRGSSHGESNPDRSRHVRRARRPRSHLAAATRRSSGTRGLRASRRAGARRPCPRRVCRSRDPVPSARRCVRATDRAHARVAVLGIRRDGANHARPSTRGRICCERRADSSHDVSPPHQHGSQRRSRIASRCGAAALGHGSAVWRHRQARARIHHCLHSAPRPATPSIEPNVGDRRRHGWIVASVARLTCRAHESSVSTSASVASTSAVECGFVRGDQRDPGPRWIEPSMHWAACRTSSSTTARMQRVTREPRSTISFR